MSAAMLAPLVTEGVTLEEEREVTIHDRVGSRNRVESIRSGMTKKLLWLKGKRVIKIGDVVEFKADSSSVVCVRITSISAYVGIDRVLEGEKISDICPDGPFDWHAFKQMVREFFDAQYPTCVVETHTMVFEVLGFEVVL